MLHDYMVSLHVVLTEVANNMHELNRKVHEDRSIIHANNETWRNPASREKHWRK